MLPYIDKKEVFACKSHRNYFHEFTHVQALLDNRFFTTSLIAMKNFMDQLYEASLINASLMSSYQRKTYIYHALLLHHPTYFKYFHLLRHNGRVPGEMHELVQRVLNEEFLTRYQNETQDNQQPLIKVLERFDLREMVQPLDYYTLWSNRTLTAQLALRDNPRVQEVVPIFQINANPSVMVNPDIPLQDPSEIINNRSEIQRIISPKSLLSSGNQSSGHSEILPNRSEIYQSGMTNQAEININKRFSGNQSTSSHVEINLRTSEIDRLNLPASLRLSGIEDQPGSGIFQLGNSAQLSPKYYKPVEESKQAPVDQVVTRSKDTSWESPFINGNGLMHIPKNDFEMEQMQHFVDSRNPQPFNAQSDAHTQESTLKLFPTSLVTNLELEFLINSGPSTAVAMPPSQKIVATPPKQRKRDSKYSQKSNLLQKLVPAVIDITDDKHDPLEAAYKYQADYVASQHVIQTYSQPRASTKKIGKRKREEEAVLIAQPVMGLMHVQQVPPGIDQSPSSHQLDQLLLKMSRFEAQRAMQLTFMAQYKPLYDRRLVESLQGYASALYINTNGWEDLDYTSAFANKLDYDHYEYDRFPVHMRSPQRVVTPVFAFFDKGLTINHLKLRVLDSASLASPYDLLFHNLLLDSSQGLSDINKEVLTKFVQLYTPFHNFDVSKNSMSRSPTQNFHFTDVTSRQEIKDEDKVKYLTDKINALQPSQHLADIKHAHSIVAANIDKIRQVAQLSVLAMAPPGNDHRQD